MDGEAGRVRFRGRRRSMAPEILTNKSGLLEIRQKV
jgi:hypothetical protein